MKNAKPGILLIEDDPSLGRLLLTTLGDREYTVAAFTNGREGLNAVRNQSFSLVMLDLGLPDLDGQEIIRRIRQWSMLPILVLSARNQENDITLALDNGADDYLTKPFSNGELLSRIRALLRRVDMAAAPEIKVFHSGELKIELTRRRVFVADREVHLTPIEFRLLTELARHAGFVVTRRHLLEKVWGASYIEHDHYLRIYMGQIRHKIETDPARPQYVLTEAGVGYRLRDDTA